MKQNCPLLIAFLVLSLALPLESQNSPRREEEQSSFGGEEVPGVPFIQRPVSVPDSVLEILKADETVKACLSDNAPTAEAPFALGFVASEVHLNGSQEHDLVVLPSPRVNQPDYMCFHTPGSFGWFWIVRQTNSQYQLVLKAIALGFDIVKTKHLGYRDIEAVSPSAAGRFITTVTFRFDGKHYREYRKQTRENR